ncbi:hypothetical protein AaE_000901 [Aphanomyces astaci]|uniref:Large ribosomal subunit protein uL24c n=1 Tax=Aphanomyces astaci TaxID=112090 RepID=A0A6A5AYQ3_APHAT|nr:hypothetical protein AaE_000901 [Aphanomyces astaci]
MRKMPKREKFIPSFPSWNIFRGDLVEVISGPHRGKQGEVKEVIREKNAVVLNDINMRHRYVKAKPGVAPGRIYLAPGAIHYSNVNLIDPSIGYVQYLKIYPRVLSSHTSIYLHVCRKPTRIGIRFGEDGERLRISKKSGTIIPKPDVLKERQSPRRTETGPLDTAPEDVLERTVDDSEITRL